MKKKILSLAVAAGLSGVMAGAAHAAMHINDKGMGEALVYPFYSAEGGNDTYIHVVNTTKVTKAVKVRFIEAENSAEVLDFNLYLSPEDVWAAAITVTPEGGAAIRTTDTSCTVPDLGQTGGGHVGTKTRLASGKVEREQQFVRHAYANFKSFDPESESEVPTIPDANTSITRTTQGYVEIIEMGQLYPDTGLGATAVHNADGIPKGRTANADGTGTIDAMNPCQSLVAAWRTAPAGVWTGEVGTEGAATTGLYPWDGEDGGLAGGLWGYGVVINVQDGTSVGYDAIAIDDFNSTETPRTLHYAPGNNLPSLQQAQLVATIFDGAEATDYVFGAGDEAVSALFMSSTISNDYVVDPAINAATDWVVTMPTKRFFSGYPVRAPFTRSWNGREACEAVGVEHWDREEAFTPELDDSGFSPRPPQIEEDGFSLCTEVSIVQFGDRSVLNGSERITYGFDPDYTEGWARMSFDPTASGLSSGLRRLTGTDWENETDVDFVGLPVVGFAAIAYQNGTLAGGVLSNYGAGVTHKSEQVIAQPQ